MVDKKVCPFNSGTPNATLISVAGQSTTTRRSKTLRRPIDVTQNDKPVRSVGRSVGPASVPFAKSRLMDAKRSEKEKEEEEC